MNLFIGVVEDIDDPIQSGRVRVRVFGDHTDDRIAIPIDTLPWAPVMLPTTSPSISGKGHTPFLVTGSWVVGFYTDESKQSPIIMGTLPGFPTEKIDPLKGFSDPSGVYPVWTDDSDITYAAREEMYQQHPSYLERVDKRHTDVQTAAPPRVTTVAPDKEEIYYQEQTWDEPEILKDHTPMYPDNHVFETEQGHLQEFDDTEGSMRYHRYHPAGSYEEIVNDGTRTIKVVGKDYEMYMQGQNIYVYGSINVTCTGDMRQLVGGNYHLEVEKDYTMNIKGSMQSKIGVNFEQEIVRTRSVNIGGSDQLFVKVDQTESIQGNKTLTVGLDNVSTISNNDNNIVIGNRTLLVNGNHGMTNVGTLTITSKGNITFDTPNNMTLAIEQNLNEIIGGNQSTQVTGNIDIDATRIDFN